MEPLPNAPLKEVLLVEDDPLIAKTLKMSLPYKGFQITPCETFQKGLETFLSGSFDLIMLDINLPDGSGLDLCREIRKRNESIPVLMVTAKSDEDTAVLSFEGGADDFIRKPYGVQELAARMSRLLQRRSEKPALLQFSAIRIDVKKRMAWIGEKTLHLGKREFEILSLLVKKAGEVVTRNEILDALGEEGQIYDRTIDSHLSHLRKKMKEAGSETLQIQPVYGVGYRLGEK